MNPHTYIFSHRYIDQLILPWEQLCDVRSGVICFVAEMLQDSISAVTSNQNTWRPWPPTDSGPFISVNQEAEIEAALVSRDTFTQLRLHSALDLGH